MVTETKQKELIEVLKDRVNNRKTDNRHWMYTAFSDGEKSRAFGRMDEDEWFLKQIKELWGDIH